MFPSLLPPEMSIIVAVLQLAGQVAATREAEARVGQAISRWEGEKVDRLKFRKDYYTKCSEAQVCFILVLTST